MNSSDDVWLCFSGGNAIGAYHEGVHEALSEAGTKPNAVSGAFIGAIIAALITGNEPVDRISNADPAGHL
ncbi:patatin-like phospholipase family protein [Rhizobium glycinendophyticum]|uniref:PNPLA domain-containing protein n=1 Tax=Rhizobium glycinendophyticum TaxID=2589807 RepID=A0A504TPT4_9HYPH|nr:hypothetical protein FJQ55_22630 [Rhizobium glycinendophyticum]